VRVLWTQRAVKFLDLTIKNIDGKKNCADLGTKSHPAAEHRRLCEMNYLMNEEDVIRPPTAEVNAVSAVGGTAVRSALVALLMALLGEQSEAHDDRVALRGKVAFGLVDITQELDVYTIRVSTFNLWLITLGLLVIILMLAGMIVLGWKILRELRAGTGATPSVAAEVLPRKPAGAREPDLESRTVMCQSPATYKWWWAKPEFRALHARDHGCWAD